jgi:glutamyl-tRNA(Gln) amidotransferase subunit E
MNYKNLGLKIGLEIHQQLDTSKLFCACPSTLQEREPDLVVRRSLHAVAGELGEVDPAAMQAFLRGKTYTYNFYNDSNCLVELDEEPPKSMNKEALNAVLEVALMLNSDIIDELHIMRKTVVDGSNTSGFQRTSLVAVDGNLQLGDLKVGIPTICIEEDAARILQAKEKEVVYSLDRLGIPLIELATSPDIHTPEDARKVAQALGAILRATGKVKRGIGTIRQDLNISIKDGARIEVKGIQELNILSKVAENEVKRQVNLIEIKKELKKRKIKKVSSKFTDLSKLLEKTKSKVLSSALERGGIIAALKLEKFSGLLGKEVQPERRFGTELSDYAKAYGAKGLFHGDELPGYGITEQEVSWIKETLKLGKNDSFILIADKKEICEKAVKAVAERINIALKEVRL